MRLRRCRRSVPNYWDRGSSVLLRGNRQGDWRCRTARRICWNYKDRTFSLDIRKGTISNICQ